MSVSKEDFKAKFPSFFSCKISWRRSSYCFERVRLGELAACFRDKVQRKTNLQNELNIVTRKNVIIMNDQR